MGRSGHNVSDFDIFLGNVSSKKERDINRLNEESNMILNVNLYKTAQNRRSVNTNATFFLILLFQNLELSEIISIFAASERTF